jgi:hypothetical protein
MKMKVFELERVTTTQDETSAAFRKLRLESDMLMKKNKVLQTEYYSLQNETDRRLADAASQKQLAESRLQTYEALESELDGAVLNATSADSKSDAAMMAQLMQSIGQVGSVCVCACAYIYRYIHVHLRAYVCVCMHAWYDLSPLCSTTHTHRTSRPATTDASSRASCWRNRL